MLQTLLALAVVAATGGWMLWRTVRPALARASSAAADEGCACGDGGGACKPKAF